jgi:hypothetical protein
VAANPCALHWFVDSEHFHGLQDPAVQQEFADAAADAAAVDTPTEPSEAAPEPS